MITQNYIKMCEQAEEIQKAWIPRCGDILANEVAPLFSDNWNIYLGNIPTHNRYLNRHFFRGGGGISKAYRNMNKKDFIYLPTQEQLQEIILPVLKEKYNKAWDLKKMNREGNWVIRIFFGFVGHNIADKQNNYIWNSSNCITELWLAFVMKEKYNKVWTSEKWEASQSKQS